MVCAGITHGFRTNLDVIEGNLNAQRYLDEILAALHVPMFQNNANITLFQHDNATNHRPTARDTEFPQGEKNIAFINDWPGKSLDLNPTVHLWDNLDQRVRRHSAKTSLNLGMEQHSTSRNQSSNSFGIKYLAFVSFLVFVNGTCNHVSIKTKNSTEKNICG